MKYILREARTGSGKRDSIMEWYASNPTEETFENYKNSEFYIEQPRASWYSTMSLIRRGQLDAKTFAKKKHTETAPKKADNINTSLSVDGGKILHGDLLHTYGAAGYFKIENFDVSYLYKADNSKAVFEADFNYVNLDTLSRMLVKTIGRKAWLDKVADYLEDKSNSKSNVYVVYDQCDLETQAVFLVKARNHDDKILTFKKR